MSPCPTGWSDTDEDGVEVYCCEQPGGAMECRTITPEHDECVIVEGEDGSMQVSCDETDVRAVKEAEENGK